MESNTEFKNNHDVEEESPRLFIFLVPGEYSVFLPQYRTLTMLKCTTHIIIACLTVMKLPLILSMLHYTNF